MGTSWCSTMILTAKLVSTGCVGDGDYDGVHVSVGR